MNARAPAVPILVQPQITYAPPPALVSAENADYLGMRPAQIKDALREMERHPVFGAAVVRMGRDRLAPPDKVIDFLKTRPRPVASEPEEDEETKASRAAWGE